MVWSWCAESVHSQGEYMIPVFSRRHPPREPLTWTPPVCQVKIFDNNRDQLQSYIRPIDGLFLLASMIFAGRALSEQRAYAQEIPRV